MSAMQFRTIESPVGPLTLAGVGRNLMHLSWSTRAMNRVIAVGSATTRRSQTVDESSTSSLIWLERASSGESGKRWGWWPVSTQPHPSR